MTSSTNTQPDTTSGNPFDLIAYLLFMVRQSLELDGNDRPPRWLRIARARETQADSDFIGKGVKAAASGFVNMTSWMSELLLDIEEVLVQTDAAKALVETTIKFFEAATSDTFKTGLETLTGATIEGSALTKINDTMSQIEGVLDYIPEPDDVSNIGHELYRLLCVVQWPLPRRYSELPPHDSGDTQDPHEHIYVDVSNGTGKLRLLQWAYNLDYTVHGLGTWQSPESDTATIQRFATRRLYTDDPLDDESFAYWRHGDREFELFRFAYSGDNSTKDIEEAHLLLDKLGYRYYIGTEAKEPSQATPAERQQVDTLTKRLERFQMLNNLPITGQLDNDSINRLLNLDFGRKNLARARPFNPDLLPALTQEINQRSGYFFILNADAETPQRPVITDRGAYHYSAYEVGNPVPVTGGTDAAPAGWLSDSRTTVRVPDDAVKDGTWSNVDRLQGFVALQSRRLVDAPAAAGERKVYDFAHEAAWYLSEGESASGKYFFSARSVEPWIPGRNGTPGADALFGPHSTQPAAGSYSHMYQWVDLQPLLNVRTQWGLDATTDIYLTASVLQRALFREGIVDMARVRIELYDRDPSNMTGALRPSPADPNDATEPPPPYAQSGWFPSSAVVDASLHLSNSARKRNWVYRKTPELLVPSGMTKALVILEGKLSNGRDIDAYFDDVKLRWEIREK